VKIVQLKFLHCLVLSLGKCLTCCAVLIIPGVTGSDKKILCRRAKKDSQPQHSLIQADAELPGKVWLPHVGCARLLVRKRKVKQNDCAIVDRMAFRRSNNNQKSWLYLSKSS